MICDCMTNILMTHSKQWMDYWLTRQIVRVVAVATYCLDEHSSKPEAGFLMVSENFKILTPTNGALIPGGLVHVVPGVFIAAVFIPIRCWFLTSFGFHWWSLLYRDDSQMTISIAEVFHYLIFEWSFISKLSISCVSEEFRSPDWNGLLTTGLLVTNGIALLFLLVEMGCRISWKEFSETKVVLKKEWNSISSYVVVQMVRIDSARQEMHLYLVEERVCQEKIDHPLVIVHGH